MKVYILVESIYYDYEGGNDTIHGVYGSKERAFKEVLNRIPGADINAEEWDYGDVASGDQHVLICQVEEIVE